MCHRRQNSRTLRARKGSLKFSGRSKPKRRALPMAMSE